MKALAMAEPQMTIATMTRALPPLTVPMTPASSSSTPVCSRPLMTTKSPMKNSSVLQSTRRSMAGAGFPAASRVTTAISTPMQETVRPVCAWVTSSTTAQRKMIQLMANPRLLTMAAAGSGYSAICRASVWARDFRKQR